MAFQQINMMQITNKSYDITDCFLFRGYLSFKHFVLAPQVIKGFSVFQTFSVTNLYIHI